PGFGVTTTISGTSPEIVEPDLVILLETTTPMKDGSVSGGLELLPGLEVQVSPQAGGFVLMVAAKPLKLSGAGPPLSTLLRDQSWPQNSTFPVAVWSPTTKAP